MRQYFQCLHSFSVSVIYDICTQKISSQSSTVREDDGGTVLLRVSSRPSHLRWTVSAALCSQRRGPSSFLTAHLVGLVRSYELRRRRSGTVHRAVSVRAGGFLCFTFTYRQSALLLVSARQTDTQLDSSPTNRARGAPAPRTAEPTRRAVPLT